jgi:LuxR family maltose regulon positive regulatory protein
VPHSERAAGPVTALAGGLGGSLRDAKLAIPPLVPGAVNRSALIERSRSSGCRVVGVTAPAGYGKTTLLAEWARTEDRPVGWVSLDRFDDDPAVVLSMLASAFSQASNGSSDDLSADMRGPGVAALGRAAPRLAAALAQSPTPFALFVDDLHELRDPGCQDVLEVVLAAVPARSQVVIASRSEQGHLPRLRATGGALEIGPPDLALGVEGVRQVFRQADIDLGPDLAASVTARTEGWPVGVYLAALRAREDPRATPEVAGDDRYVADYLYSEALVKQPPTRQRFLRRTAVLDQIRAPLCDAVLDTTGSARVLRDLEAASSFLVPLDHRRQWFRYHALFREFLLAELRRREPEIEALLHRRAAEWYEANGSPAIALEHLLSTGDVARSAQLATTLIRPAYSNGQVSTVERWLAEIGDASIAASPRLTVLAGWASALTGRTSEAERWAALVEPTTSDDPGRDGTASLASAKAMLRALMCASGPERMLADALFAVDHEPSWSRWRDTALVLLAEAQLVTGDLDAAGPTFEEAAAVGRALGYSNTVVVSECELATMAMDRGDWDDAADRLRVAIDVIDEHRMHDYALSPLAFVGAARLAHHRGDPEMARRRVAQAMRARPACTAAIPTFAVRLRMQLGRVHLALGDVTTARHLMREIDDVLRVRPKLGTLLEQVAQLRSALEAHGGRASEGNPPLSPAELRLLPYLQTHLTYPEIAGRLFVSHNTVRSQVGSIYRKLGVASRDDAMRRATEVGLLGG